MDELRTKKSTPSLQATSYTEVTRMHASSLASKGSIVITSTTENEGSSLVSYLMAQRSAESGSKTLLVDLNMKNTQISDMLASDRLSWNLSERPNDDNLSDLFVKVKGLEHLYVLPAPLDPVSIHFLKSASRASHFFKTLEEQFDNVVVDTSSIDASNRFNADPITLAMSANRTALVMLAGVTAKRKVESAVRQLREAGAHIEGLIINDRENPSPKEQLLRFTRLLKKIVPGFGEWLHHKVLHNEHLD